MILPTHRLVPIAFATLLLTGCEAVPHPFEDDRPEPHAPILTVPDTVGVVVEPISGAPAPSAQALTDAMVAALQAQEIPAFTKGGNRFSFHLSGTAEVTADGRVAVHWTMRAADGKELGRDVEYAAIPPDQWQAGSFPDFSQFTKPAVAKLAGLIEEPLAVEHKPPHQVFIRKVEGAPGNGGTALPEALTYLLKQHLIDVTPDAQASDTVTIAATVAVVAGDKGQDHVTIAWRVLKPDGKEVGQIKQENDVPHGTLDGHWGDVAMAIAAAAVDDIVRVIGLAPAAAPPPP